VAWFTGYAVTIRPVGLTTTCRYETGGLGSADFDLGVMAETVGIGPTMRLTLSDNG
jgi:hypothetical protein